MSAGVAYQLRPSDPLIDTEQCTRDATLMKTLGVNSIRVYHVNPKADHSGCMSAFANAGIYVIVDLDDFDTYILGVSFPRLSLALLSPLPWTRAAETTPHRACVPLAPAFLCLRVASMVTLQGRTMLTLSPSRET